MLRDAKMTASNTPQLLPNRKNISLGLLSFWLFIGAGFSSYIVARQALAINILQASIHNK